MKKHHHLVPKKVKIPQKTTNKSIQTLGSNNNNNGTADDEKTTPITRKTRNSK
jgi:hypothetical protein